MSFKDNFSNISASYALYRPHYPKDLFTFLSSLVKEHQVAWDCGTGNGQVAVELTNYFEKVYASDASEQQIIHAQKNPKVEYFISLAESTNLETSSIDLITVAQAFHWFKADLFYAEVKRVLKPQGVIALWCYGLCDIPNASINLNTSLQKFYDAVEPFWDTERQLVQQEYRSIAFPFTELWTAGGRDTEKSEILSVPSFSMSQDWTVEQLLGYLCTWSSYQKYIMAHGADSLLTLKEEISQNWSSNSKTMTINWPLYFRIGTIAKTNLIRQT